MIYWSLECLESLWYYPNRGQWNSRLKSAVSRWWLLTISFSFPMIREAQFANKAFEQTLSVELCGTAGNGVLWAYVDYCARQPSLDRTSRMVPHSIASQGSNPQPLSHRLGSGSTLPPHQSDELSARADIQASVVHAEFIFIRLKLIPFSLVVL